MFKSKDPSKMNKEEALKELIYLSKIIERHDKLYYQNDSPEISDSEYDRLKGRNADLEKYFPTMVLKNSPFRKKFMSIRQIFSNRIFTNYAI